MVSSALLVRALRADPLESLLARAQQTLLDALGDAILLLDSQCQVIYANRVAQALLRKAAPTEPWQPGRPLVRFWPKLAAQIREGVDGARRGHARRSRARPGSTTSTSRMRRPPTACAARASRCCAT